MERRARLLVAWPDGSTKEANLADEMRLGRAPENDLVLDDREISRRQAVIRLDPKAGYFLLDLGSSNGTLLNGRRLLVPARLRDGDEIRIGRFRLEFRAPELRPQPSEDCLITVGSPINVAGPSSSGQHRVLLGVSPAMDHVFRLIDRAARSDLSVLIAGETGTGKELVARGVHQLSARAEKPFLALNCAAIPEPLLESELFGHRRGVFTDAKDDQAGLLETATGGTLFLDEVGEMPLGVQPKLLRALQEQEVRRVGESRTRRIDVRVIAATNRDLYARVAQGAFRSDLYYRIAAFPIRLPALRERREDIPLLAQRFLSAAARRFGKAIRGIDPEAVAHLASLPWYGNVRELENEVRRAVVFAEDGDTVGLPHFSETLRTGRAGDLGPADAQMSDGAPSTQPGEPLRDLLARTESRHILEMLEQEHWNVTRAARALGLTRSGLHKKIREYGIQRHK